jgi:hypothetical protein
MAWVAAIVVLLLLVFSAGFRKAAGVLIAIAAITVAIFVLYQQSPKERNAPESPKPVRIQQHEFENGVRKP